MIKNATKQGYLKAFDGDGIDLENGTRKGRRGTVQNGLIQTPNTQDNKGVVVSEYIGTYNYAKSDKFIGNGNRLNIDNELSEIILTSGNQAGVMVKGKPIQEFGTYYIWGNNKGEINTQCNRAANPNNSALTIACANTGDVVEQASLRIRKLTPRECWKLMGVKPSDYDKVAEHQSNASLYHLAGDSIVVQVLMGLFGELLDINWKDKVNEIVGEIRE